MHAGIDGVAVTDHNSGEWVDRIKEAYTTLEKTQRSDFRPIVVFPGVEINAHGGIHILAILDATKGASDIDHLCGAVGLPSCRHAGSITSKTPLEVVEIVNELDGLAIPAHIDSANGVLRQLSGASLKAVLECRGILAAEATSEDCLDACHPAPGWSLVLGSDSHHPDSTQGVRFPGSHYTWVKMGEPSIEGLRLALGDGSPLSIRRSDTESGNPNQHPSQVIESITITGAQYAGRSSPLQAHFSPWMTAIVGGRGTGKSTIVEMLRLALRRQNDMPESMRAQFADFAAVPRGRGGPGALTGNSEAVVTMYKSGRHFRIGWKLDGSETPIEEENSAGQWIRGEGDVRERFPVRILSQKQVLEMSRDPNSLLKVIDDSPQVNRAGWDSRNRELEARFLRVHSELREAEARLQGRALLQGELSDIKGQLRVFEKGGHRELLLAYRRFRRQRRMLDDRVADMEESVRRLREMSDALDPTDISEEDFSESVSHEVDALKLLQRAATGQRGVRGRVEAEADQLENFHMQWRRDVTNSAWAKQARETEESLSSLQERLSQQGVRDIGDYGRLVQRRTLLEQRLSDLHVVEEYRARTEKQTEEALLEIQRWREELTRRRMAFCRSLLTENDLVRASLVPFGDDPQLAEPEFRNRLYKTDGRLAKDILDVDIPSGILRELYEAAPDDPSGRDAAMTDKIIQIKRQVVAIANGGTDPNRTKWFHTHVRQLRSDQLAYFQLWWPEDSLRIEYRRNGTSPFVSLGRGSLGQKSAAILTLLLGHGDEPIILDQPEDDLDNHVIQDLVVRLIRVNKRRRQVILVTHNPNIVVNGDAEQVIAMDYRNGQCVVLGEETGALQDPAVRDQVCRVMEGGRRAFMARYKRLLSTAGHG